MSVELYLVFVFDLGDVSRMLLPTECGSCAVVALASNHETKKHTRTHMHTHTHTLSIHSLTGAIREQNTQIVKPPQVRSAFMRKLRGSSDEAMSSETNL